jgi:hypothetical protein
LTGEAAIARVGILTYYLPGGKTRRELVPEQTLFQADSMASLKMKPVTNAHPPTLVDATNAGRRKVGFTGETIKRDADFLKTTLTVTDKEAVDAVESGRQELSPGYRAEVVMHAGTHNGEHYDAIQVKRTYNHVALCDKARGGADLRLNFDGVDLDKLDSMSKDDDNNPPNKRSRFMARITLDAIDYDADQQVINHLRQVETARGDLQTKLDTATAERDTVTAERDTLKTRVDELETAAKDDSKTAVAVKARIDLERVARKHLDEKECEGLEAKSDADVRKLVILKRFPDVKLDEASAEYLAARFDAAVELLDKNDGNGANGAPGGMAQQRTAVEHKADSSKGEPDQNKSRADMAQRQADAWKGNQEKK